MTYRVRNIAIAVGLAVVAALLTVFYVSNYKKSVNSGAETVTVLVAARDIPIGLLGSQVISEKMLATKEIPRQAAVAGSISRPEEISGLIATQPTYIGEQVSARRFGPLSEAGVRTQLKGTYRAMQFKGDPNQILSGVLRPGDHVDVVASVPWPAEDSSYHYAKVILRDVLVLRTSGATDASASVVDPNGDNGWVMLRIADGPQDQAMLHVYEHGDPWWLALRPGLRAVNAKPSYDDATSLLRRGIVADNLKQRIPGGRGR
jgi:Flp pilus assembly protein CpaB